MGWAHQGRIDAEQIIEQGMVTSSSFGSAEP
jgi:hypothetical protein